MKRITLITVILLMIGGAFAPSYSQKYTLINADSTIENKTLGNKFAYTYLYLSSGLAEDTNDSIRVYTYNPALNRWIDAKLINLILNTETTAGSPLIVPGGVTYIFAFYELYLSGFKIVRTNFVGGNDDTLSVFVKNILGG